jgi:hypothetical protein
VKPTYLIQHGHDVSNPKLPDDDFAEAVAMNIGSGDAKLVLLCPAWKKYGTVRTVKPDTMILHSRADDVVPFADSEELAKTVGRRWSRSATIIDWPIRSRWRRC